MVNFGMIFMQRYLKYNDTDFCLEIAPITRVMAIKAKGSANYGPPCIIFSSSNFLVAFLSSPFHCSPKKCATLNGHYINSVIAQVHQEFFLHRFRKQLSKN